MFLKVVFSCLILCMSTGILAKVRNITTPRIDAMGGAGVGAMLMDEATFLNPAPLAFFGKTSFYYQTNKSTITEYSGLDTLKEPTSKAYAISDTAGRIKGSLRYSYQSEFHFSKKEWAVSFGTIIGKQSAFGITYHKVKDKIKSSFGDYDEQYSKFDIGVSHVIAPQFSVGVLIRDVMKKKKEDNVTTLGFQWIYLQFITMNADFSFNYNGELSDTFGYRLGLQIMFLQDLYLRTGYFDDSNERTRGSSVGISWVSPRFKIDFALKNTKHTRYSELNNESFKLKETSFSVAYYF